MGLYSHYIFPRLLDWALGTSEHQRHRRLALAPVQGDVLEIGFGTGLNLPHYPEKVTRLTGVDSERMLQDKVDRRTARAPMPVERMQLDAAERLPLGDNSFDSVVTTWTLCSISDPASALAEIRRVLKPNGQYVFLEHGRSDDPRVARRQDLFNPIQKIIGRGCHINRPIDRFIKEAGLEILVLDRFLMPKMPRILGEMYRGIAKPRNG